MKTYYIRTVAEDFSQLLDLCFSADAMKPGIQATHGGCWDYIGLIYDDEGNALKDNEGKEYLHINLITPIFLDAVLADYLLLDEHGNARAPANPYRVFA